MCAQTIAVFFQNLSSELQELIADGARIELTRRNAALLEQKAAEERARLFALRPARPVDSLEMPPQAITQPTAGRVDPAAVNDQELRKKFAKEQTNKHQKDSPLWKHDKDEAEAWTPRAVRRRG